eukprot:11143478-Lingulodinium_polyedra.AAC.1
MPQDRGVLREAVPSAARRGVPMGTAERRAPRSCHAPHVAERAVDTDDEEASVSPALASPKAEPGG